MRELFAEELLGAAVESGFTDEYLERFLQEFEATAWVRIRDKAYPPAYAYGLGKYRAHPAAVARMRREISSVPRVRPEQYDILLNIEGTNPLYPGPTWDIVKWMRVPENVGWMPGWGWTAIVLLEPYPVYDVPAWRDPLSLSDRDYAHLRRNATTMREGGEGLNRDLYEHNLRKQFDRQRRREEEDLDFAAYYRDAFRRSAEEMGI